MPAPKTEYPKSGTDHVFRAAFATTWKTWSVPVLGSGALGEIDEAGEVLPQLLADGLVGELARLVEDAGGTRHHDPRTEPRARSERAKHGEPRGLGEDRAEAAGRGAHQGDRPAAEHPADVGRRARQPVDRVLEHAGHRVVVLRGHEKQPIGRLDAGLEALHRARDAL